MYIYILGIVTVFLNAIPPNETGKLTAEYLMPEKKFAPDCKPSKILLDFKLANLPH